MNFHTQVMQVLISEHGGTDANHGRVHTSLTLKVSDAAGLGAGLLTPFLAGSSVPIHLMGARSRCTLTMRLIVMRALGWSLQTEEEYELDE